MGEYAGSGKFTGGSGHTLTDLRLGGSSLFERKIIDSARLILDASRLFERKIFDSARLILDAADFLSDPLTEAMESRCSTNFPFLSLDNVLTRSSDGTVVLISFNRLDDGILGRLEAIVLGIGFMTYWPFPSTTMVPK